MVSLGNINTGPTQKLRLPRINEDATVYPDVVASAHNLAEEGMSEQEARRLLHDNHVALIEEAAEEAARRGAPNKYLVTTAAILAALTAVLVAQNKSTAVNVDKAIHFMQNFNKPMTPPDAEHATQIRIGDTVMYTTSDGKTHKRQIRLVSDITAAAEAVDSGIDDTDMNNMLMSEHKGDTYQNGDVFSVDEGLGIRDITPHSG